MKTTKYALALAMGLIGLLVPDSVRANSIVFTATGTFQDGTTLSGQITLDATSGAPITQTLALGAPASLGPFTTALGFNTIVGPLGTLDAILLTDSTSNDFLDLIYKVPDLANPIAISLCSFTVASICTVNGVDFWSTFYSTPQSTQQMELNSGELTPIATIGTPEPSSLLLLCTGLLGMAGAARRKLFS